MHRTGHRTSSDHGQTSGTAQDSTRKTAVIAAVATAALVAGTPAIATEGGGSHYPNGAEDFMVGALPPPGNYFIDYLSWYSADSFRDGDGGRLFQDFNLDVVANTFRFIHVTEHKVLGANWALHAFVPLANVDVSRRIAPPFPRETEDRFGLGDIIVDPFILGWHGKDWHVTTGVDIYLPTGAYDKDWLANIGRNYWTFEPIFAFTYLNQAGFEASAKLMYDFSTENNATNYHSGQAFHADYTIGYHTGPWSLGVGGYYYQQTTDDELDGRTFLGGFRGRAFAIGPEVKYDHKNMAFTLKYLAETAVENRPEGGSLWFKFLYAF
ncbi:MAG: transporter [Thiohalocapsa sp.]|jgi:hypothetical protein|uniref:SphA family protein n=1 Tax=Thiohalocapsa sp. TaxID=2497641 RepID=UPI0025E360C3|nr:transporter [Thiohalocapsa sp.]MCG6941815.1 transporter [Thiohalocapsa sp.]